MGDVVWIFVSSAWGPYEEWSVAATPSTRNHLALKVFKLHQPPPKKPKDCGFSILKSTMSPFLISSPNYLLFRGGFYQLSPFSFLRRSINQQSIAFGVDQDFSVVGFPLWKCRHCHLSNLPCVPWFTAKRRFSTIIVFTVCCSQELPTYIHTDILLPTGSMYDIFTYIYHKDQPGFASLYPTWTVSDSIWSSSRSPPIRSIYQASVAFFFPEVYQHWFISAGLVSNIVILIK